MIMIKTFLKGVFRIAVTIRKAFISDYTSYFRKMGVIIGEDCKFIVNPNFWDLPDMGSEPYLIKIGNHVTISFGCTFVTHDGANWVFRELERYKDVIIAGAIIIGDNCFIGCNSTILPGVTIGHDCIIGAGSLVTKPIPSGEVWGGVPAHFIMKTKDFAEKKLELNPIHEPITKENKQRELMRLYMDEKINNINK